MLTILVLLIIAWVGVGTQFVLQRRREGRAESSVAFFRQQLSTLERATPGSTMRRSRTGPIPVVSTDGAAAPDRVGDGPRVVDMRRRRREVLFGLVGASVVSLLLRLVAPGAVTTLLLVLSIGCLGAYVWALRQRQLALQARNPSAAVPLTPIDGSAEPVRMIDEPSSESVRIVAGAVGRPTHGPRSSAS